MPPSTGQKNKSRGNSTVQIQEHKETKQFRKRVNERLWLLKGFVPNTGGERETRKNVLREKENLHSRSTHRVYENVPAMIFGKLSTRPHGVILNKKLQK
jgi:hypothetical protein